MLECVQLHMASSLLPALLAKSTKLSSDMTNLQSRIAERISDEYTKFAKQADACSYGIARCRCCLTALLLPLKFASARATTTQQTSSASISSIVVEDSPVSSKVGISLTVCAGAGFCSDVVQRALIPITARCHCLWERYLLASRALFVPL